MKLEFKIWLKLSLIEGMLKKDQWYDSNVLPEFGKNVLVEVE